MLQKNLRLELVIEGYSSDGKGIARYNGIVIFVKGALKDEHILAKIILVKKDYAVAILERVFEGSPHRQTPACSVYAKCGGCGLMHMQYAHQLEFKTNKLKEALTRIAGITDIDVPLTEASPKRLNYRNKLSLPIGTDNDGNIISGFYAQNSHRIVPNEGCVLQQENSQKIVKIIKEFMTEFSISAYDESTQKGLIRHIIVRDLIDSAVCVAVINGAALPHSSALGERVVEALGKNSAFYVNFNTKNTNVITGEKYQFICGKKDLITQFNGIKISLHPASFFQINDDVFLHIYDDIKSIIKNQNPQIIIDAYSGAGLLTASLSTIAETVYGIEISAAAVADANRCAALNNIKNMHFINSDCAFALPDLLKRLAKQNVALVLDPPRKGCDPQIIKAIKTHLPQTVTYLSCNPATLARDLKELATSYKIQSIQPYDMFPHTEHLETLCHLKKIN